MTARPTRAGLLEAYRRRYHPLHRLRRLRAVRWVGRHCDVQVWVRLYGVSHPVRIWALRNGSYLLNRRSPEPQMAALLMAILETSPVRMFWDVGANIGYYSWLVRSRQPATRVVAIEPDPVNCRLLRQTIHYAPGVEILDVAISRVDGSARFLLDTVAGSTGTLEPAETFNETHYGERPVPHDVRTRSLDSLVAQYGAPDFVKIDIEGHESAALDGGADMLAADPIALIEVFDAGSPALRAFRTRGYALLAAATLRDEQPEDGNYLAWPRSRAAALEPLRIARALHLAAMGLDRMA